MKHLAISSMTVKVFLCIAFCSLLFSCKSDKKETPVTVDAPASIQTPAPAPKETPAPPKKIERSEGVDATLEKKNITVKETAPSDEVKAKIKSKIEKQVASSFLNGVSAKDAIVLYEKFVKSYQEDSPASEKELLKWAEDRIHNNYMKEHEWYLLKKEALDELLE